MTLRLKQMMVDACISQRALATAMRVGVTAINTLINDHVLPARQQPAQFRARLTEFLTAHEVPDAAHWDQEPIQTALPTPDDQPEESPDMLLRKYRLTPAARQHFELPRDPFEDVEEVADVFLSDDIRYVREAMYGTAINCRFLVVVGESGAGKSTLREEMMDRLRREGRDVHVIEPGTLMMAETESKGRVLRAQDIGEAIMATIAPTVPLKNSREARQRQLKQTLVDSHRAGFKHLIVIEEAHAMATSTLNHLKRFLEIKDGLRRTTGILLLGHPELALKLSEANHGVREVVQRAEILTLPPLDNNLDAYLKHRFERAGVPVARVLERGGIDALRERLAASKQRGMSLLYPQAIHNVLARAMNLAAELGPPRVTAEVMRGV
jgi:type II secretory pathway predicted ATPase ExeA